ncbi:profilin [Amycolatopsis japonica]|uniref:hypothetical protein n=1 Tax=Amycolatopsis japonica TaxID=208439 RepID=UPI0011DDD9A3|nr:hypothetical protein [Amycolatopsis japonica]
MLTALISVPQVAIADANVGSEWKPGSNISAAQSKKMISDFVAGIAGRHNIHINPADYEVVSHGKEISIRAKKQSSAAVAYRSGGAVSEAVPVMTGSSSEVSALDFNVAPPSAAEIASAKGRAALGIQAEPNWFPVECYRRTIWVQPDPDGVVGDTVVGWQDACKQLGWLPPTAGRGNWVFRMWQTCATQQERKIFTLTGCGVQNLVSSPDARWVDWSPRSELPVGQCKTISYGVTVGPITGSWSYPACDTIKIDKWNPGVYFKAWWSGRAWGKTRASELVYSFTLPEGAGASGDARISMSWDPCIYPGAGDKCQDTQ